MRCALALILAAGPLWAADVPSGQQVSLHEVLVDAQETATWLRFRFVAPGVGRGSAQISFEVAGQDMMYLCNEVALPYMAEHSLNGDKIVITFMDQYTEFGQSNPDVIQYIESFRPETGVCIWDDF